MLSISCREKVDRATQTVRPGEPANRRREVMAPKDAKAAAKGPPGESPEGEDPVLLGSNYQKYSKLLSVPVNNTVMKACNDEENRPLTQLVRSLETAAAPRASFDDSLPPTTRHAAPRRSCR